MRITLSPQRRNDNIKIIKNGDMLTINGFDFDFSPLPDGASLPAEAVDIHWFCGDIERINGELVVTLLLPLPANYSPEQAFPADLIDVPDGPVALPQPLPATDITEAFAA
ncbi:hypothetical protein [Pseudomonas sp. NPDC088444]|uniref:hypothetical protein n=1 Tax=Pseudomonas sp. NPDC088444 TaxID=3364456 RepID=UPI00384B8765